MRKLCERAWDGGEDGNGGAGNESDEDHSGLGKMRTEYELGALAGAATKESRESSRRSNLGC